MSSTPESRSYYFRTAGAMGPALAAGTALSTFLVVPEAIVGLTVLAAVLAGRMTHKMGTLGDDRFDGLRFNDVMPLVMVPAITGLGIAAAAPNANPNNVGDVLTMAGVALATSLGSLLHTALTARSFRN